MLCNDIILLFRWITDGSIYCKIDHIIEDGFVYNTVTHYKLMTRRIQYRYHIPYISPTVLIWFILCLMVVIRSVGRGIWRWLYPNSSGNGLGPLGNRHYLSQCRPTSVGIWRHWARRSWLKTVCLWITMLFLPHIDFVLWLMGMGSIVTTWVSRGKRIHVSGNITRFWHFIHM